MRRLRNWISTHRIKRVIMWGTSDLVVTLIAYTIALSTRSLTAQINFERSVAFVVAAMIITITSLYINGVYRRIWSRTSGHGIVTILRAIILASLILLIINVSTTPYMIPISALLIGNIIAFGGLVTSRYRSRLIGALEWRWRAVWWAEFPESDQERVLIVGAGESGQTIVIRLQHRINNTGYKIIGFVDDDPDKFDMYVEGKPILGTTHDIADITTEHRIDLIVVAIHNIEGSEMRRIIEECQKTKARIKVVPDMVAMMSSDISHAPLLRDIKPEDLIGRSIIKHQEGIDLSSVSERTVLVTGAAGSIGSELCRQILNFAPTKLIMLDSNESALHNLHIGIRNRGTDVEIVPALVDVTQRLNVQRIYEAHHPQLVFHAAAYKHVPMLEKYPNEAVRVNVGGTANVAELAVAYNVERFVLISTDKAVKPSSVMGATKRLCELIIHSLSEQDHETLFTAVRFGNVLGSRGSVVPTFTRQIQDGGPVTVTHRDMTRYFMSISEAVNLVIHAAAMTNGDDIFVLRMGEEVRILDIAERMIRLRGLRPYVDIDIDFIGIREGEKMHEELHTYHEDPIDTQHPKVMKINKWLMNGKAESFMDHTRYLINNGLPANINALDHLHELCMIGESNKHQIVDEV